jgi:RND family efflux transporter MFP subunit
VEYVGALAAHCKAEVACEMSGVIERLHFDKGDRVRKGQLLAEIGTTTFRLEVRVAAASLEEAKAGLSEAENNYRRVKRLYDIRAVPDSKYDEAKRALEMARALVEKANASQALAKDRLRRSKLLAPCDGIISFREVEEGEVLVIPPSVTITQVVDLKKMKIKLSMGEKDVHILETHKRFPFTVDAISGERFFCSLRFRSPAADPLTRSFPVELAVDHPDPRMADGMTARVRFPLINEKKTIKVPSTWLSEENGKIGLYVVKGGKALFKAVTLGGYYDQRVEILSGISQEEEVITNPAGLKSGDPVEY